MPWKPHPSLLALQVRLQLVADCWTLLDGAGGQSRRAPYLPQGSKESQAVYWKRLPSTHPIGFFRDALWTYAGMEASTQRRERPGGGGGLAPEDD